ncbi:hypothetical protein [Aquipuribacter hungaricus]|uniref:Uncharacterized protein n=1 Tax=Aquipuribacter hungaricus TaxID=545624 RepID=A0ABV7WI44_9MICO
MHRLNHPKDERLLGDLLAETQPDGATRRAQRPARVDLHELVQELMPAGLQWPADGAGDEGRHGSVDSLSLPTGRPRRLHGQLLVGQSGVRSDIRQQQRVVVRRQLNDVEERPLYFFMNLPKRSTRGLLLVERHGHLGVQQAFWNDVLIRAFRNRHTDLALKLEHFYPANIIEEYESRQGRINSAVVVAALRRSRAMDDLESVGPDVEEVGTLQIGVKRRWRDLTHAWGRELLGLTGGDAVTYVLPDGPEARLVEQMQAEEVRVGVTLDDGEHRTVILGQDYAPRAGYTLPDVALDAAGYPALDAMLEQALTLEPTLLRNLVVA